MLKKISLKTMFFDKVAEMLAKDVLMPYKACLIRFVSDEHLLVRGAATSDDINFCEKGYPSRNIQDGGMVGKVFDLEKK